jgi:hypothetical protein
MGKKILPVPGSQNQNSGGEPPRRGRGYAPVPGGGGGGNDAPARRGKRPVPAARPVVFEPAGTGRAHFEAPPTLRGDELTLNDLVGTKRRAAPPARATSVPVAGGRSVFCTCSVVLFIYLFLNFVYFCPSAARARS